MINQTLLTSIWSNTTATSWQRRCIQHLNSTNFTAAMLVNGLGQSIPDLTEQTWGIDIATCYAQCNHEMIPYQFDFQSFASSFTNYFLPYLALTAQLPYETGNPWRNIMSFCLAVGSPALITYSLTITILNRLWARSHFDRLVDQARGQAFGGFEVYQQRVASAIFLLQEAQQVPLRASQQDGWFSSLIVGPDNAGWWSKMEERLRRTRRGITASLAAQVATAAVAYLFTVAASFLAKLGDPATALQISSGTLWIWLIPVIMGYISCGTQSTDDSIEHALTKAREPAYRALEPPHNVGTASYSDAADQKGLLVMSGLSPQLDRIQTSGFFRTPNMQQLQIPPWFGASVGGDEELKGPIHNYARLFTWWQLAHTMDRALCRTLGNISENSACVDSEIPIRLPPGRRLIPKDLEADSCGTALYCGVGTQGLKAYAEWTDMEAEVYRRILGAACVAIFVQWGTTGASVMIAYLTPTVGMGCRSGGYLIYGGVGTVAWICLVIGMLFSHEAMLRYQNEHVANPSVVFRRDTMNPNNTPAPNPPAGAAQTAQANLIYKRGFSHNLICGLAVTFRYLGKVLCVLNTLLLLGSSLAEFTGGYSNCWCEGNVFGMGSTAWVVLFKNSSDLAAAAWLPWAGGLVLTVAVCVASYTFFALGSGKA